MRNVNFNEQFIDGLAGPLHPLTTLPEKDRLPGRRTANEESPKPERSPC